VCVCVCASLTHEQRSFFVGIIHGGVFVLGQRCQRNKKRGVLFSRDPICRKLPMAEVLILVKICMYFSELY
jgi:hypothetical protein